MQFKLTTTALAALLLNAVAAAAAPNGAASTNLARGKLARDYATLAGLDIARRSEVGMSKRCDMDFYEDCMSACPINPECPGCEIGCTIGCCGSTGCC